MVTCEPGHGSKLGLGRSTFELPAGDEQRELALGSRVCAGGDGAREGRWTLSGGGRSSSFIMPRWNASPASGPDFSAGRASDEERGSADLVCKSAAFPRARGYQFCGPTPSLGSGQTVGWARACGAGARFKLAHRP